jgi:hypothetical protein
MPEATDAHGIVFMLVEDIIVDQINLKKMLSLAKHAIAIARL